MTAPSIERVSEEASALLQHYSFDLAGYSTGQLIASWQQTYAASWIRAAVIEALYQGRYKAVSVEQILAFWLRRGQPLRHFNHEFERIVCNQSGRKRTRSTLPMMPVSGASLKTSLTTNSIEQGSEHFNQPLSPPTPNTETKPLSELPDNFIDKQPVAPISAPSTKDQSSESKHLKEDLTYPLATNELDVLGDLLQASVIDSSNHDDEDFEPPVKPALLNQIWKISERPTSPLESQYQPRSHSIAAKLANKNDTQNTSIHQFRPASDRSECYFKLRTVAQHSKCIPNPVD